jgi:hypothetical protein
VRREFQRSDVEEATMARVLAILLAAMLVAAPASAYNWALQFDGHGDYLICRDFGIEYEHLTVEAWVLMQTGGLGDMAYEIVGMPLSGSGVGFQLEMDAAHLLFDPATDACRTDHAYGFDHDEWYHIAAVYSPAGVDLYINGSFLYNGACYAGGLSVPLTDLIVGKEIPEASQHQFWCGYIDELRIWTTARTEPEIVSNMYNELTGSETGLFAYYNMNEGTGQLAHDLCSSAHDAWLGSTELEDEHDPVWVLVDSPVAVVASSWSCIKALYR